MVKSKILNSPLQKNVMSVGEMVLNLGKILVRVLCVVDTDK